MRNRMKFMIECSVYLCIFILFSKISLDIFQIISIELDATISDLNILIPIFVLFYLCIVIPIILLLIKKLKENRRD